VTNDKYAKAYKEVLEIIKYFPEEEYNKIPKEKIDFYIKNMDRNYEFSIDPLIDLSEQNISREANAIIVTLFEDYFATDEQKKKIKKILESNQNEEEDKKREQYNPDDLFKNKNKNENTYTNQSTENTSLVEYKESFFTRFKNFILNLLHLNK